jgi:hypothetical protein
MSERTASRFALVLATFAVALYTGFVVLLLLLGNIKLPSFSSTLFDEWLHHTVNMFTALAGAFLAAKRPHNPIGWLLCVIGITFLGYPVVILLVAYLYVPGMYTSLPLVWLAWLGNWIWVLAYVGIIYGLLLFPNGQLPSPRWRPVAWGAAVTLVAVLVGAALVPGPLDAARQWQNPVGVQRLGTLIMPLIMILLLFELLAIIAVVVRFFRSRGIERQQLKWIAFGAAMHGVITGIGMLFDLPRWVQAIGPAVILSAIVIAVLRYRLYEIDRIINRTLVYGILTALLAAIYFGSVVLFESLLRPLFGQNNQIAIVASTLVIAALFQPLRRRIQQVIDRRFYRRKYDAQKTLQTFSARLREEVQLDTLCDDLISTVQETMQPAHVSLWLCMPERKT